MNYLKYTILFTFTMITSLCAAQQIRYDRIEFQENPEWEDVLKQARKSGKLIFLDGYTSWCAPCKKMEKQVFSQAEVANFFNQKFINVKYDMEKGEGVTLKSRFGVSVFPTYLFVSGSGEIVHRIVGAYFGEGEFLGYSKMAVTPGKSYVDLQQRYQRGERNSELMFSYFQALRLAGEQAQEEKIVQEYLALMSKEHFMDPDYWGIVKTFLKDPTSREFKILVSNREEIGTAIGQEEVDQKIYDVFNSRLKSSDQANTSMSTRQDESILLDLLREASFPGRNVLLARVLVAQHRRNGSFQDYAGVVDAMLDFRLLAESDEPASEYNHHADIFHKLVLDKGLLEKALRWSEYACSIETDEQKRKSYQQTRNKLRKKLGMETN